MSYEPLVSIGLPVYNGERHIRQAIDSLLAQTYGDFELIISDNASTDETQQICLEYAARDERIRYYRNERDMGGVWNFNRVFELSAGEYFMWAAHDDYYDRRYLGACLKAFGISDAIVLAGTMCESIVPETGELILIDHGVSTIGLKPRERFKHYKLMLHCGKKNVGSIFCGVYKRDALRKVMPLKKVIATDHVLLAELSLQGEFVTIQEKLMAKRYGGTSKSFESIARGECITNPVLIKYSYLVREVLLQRIIFSTDKLTLREKITLACWSFSNYVKVHFIPPLHRRLRTMVRCSATIRARELWRSVVRQR
jgi:glycosyltransferase involved in cell wall biosynthesis